MTKEAFEDQSFEAGGLSVVCHSCWPVATKGLLSKITCARKLATLLSAETCVPRTNGPSPVTMNDFECNELPSC